MSDTGGSGDRVFVGAEARVEIGKTVRKERVQKGYRDSLIDKNLRKRRTKAEVKILKDAARAGVNVPRLLKSGKFNIEMERVEGKRVKEFEIVPKEISKKIGQQLGLLHSAGIAHQDLTTSNIILGDKVYFIDFGLSFYGKIEDFGVDLHLLRRALISAHKEPELSFEAVLEGYRESFADAERAIKREIKIDKRGRYT